MGSNPRSTTSGESLFTSLNLARPISKTGLIMGFQDSPYSDGDAGDNGYGIFFFNKDFI